MTYLAALHWTTAGQRLVKAVDREEVARLERLLNCTQEEAVNHYIEESCCPEDLPHLAGGRGTPAERRAALRVLWRHHQGEAV
jgi:hypothetical protein